MTAAVIFDLDGTLVDTPAGIAAALTQTVLDLGRPRPAPATVRRTIGRPLDLALPALLGTADPAAVAEAIDRYRARYAADVLPCAGDLVFPGVLAGLGRLRDRGVPLAIATSKVRLTAAQTLDAAGLARFFAVVLCHDMVSQGKPHPEIALAAAAALGADPAGCALVGDTGDDMRVAVGAGMRPIGVTYGVGGADDLRSAGAVVIADSFPGVVAALAAPGPPAGVPAPGLPVAAGSAGSAGPTGPDGPAAERSRE